MARSKPGLSSIRSILRRDSGKTSVSGLTGLPSANSAGSSQRIRPEDGIETANLSAILSLSTQKTTGARTIVPLNGEMFVESFSNLPGELQIAVLLYIDVDVLFALRMSCRTFFDVIQTHQSPIVRNILRQRDSTAAATILYPSPSPPSSATWDFLLQLVHRGSVVRKLAQKIVEFIMVKTYICKTKEQMKEFAHNLTKTLSHLLMYISHFLESYRAALVRSRDQLPDGVFPNHQKIQRQIIERYDLQSIYLAHAMFNILSLVVYRKLRPPSYAGDLERKLRGWSKQPATREDVVKLLVVGGLDEVKRVIEHKTYAERRDALEIYLRSISKTEECKAGRQASSRWLKRGSTPSEVNDAMTGKRSGEPPSTADKQRPLHILEKQTLPMWSDCIAKPDNLKVSEISTSLPDLMHLLLKPAERILLDHDFIEDASDLPTFRDFIERAMQGEAAGLIFLEGWNNGDNQGVGDVDEEEDEMEDVLEVTAVGPS
ncbi:MAG: hypothetical protein Q9187_000279 [Circinaria calcarea]